MAATPFHHLLFFLFLFLFLYLYLLPFSSSSHHHLHLHLHHHHHHNTHIIHPKPPTTSATTSSPSPLIKQACAATRFPDTCTTTLSHSQLPTSPSPPDLILATLSSSSSGLDTALSNARSLLSSSHANPNLTNAASNCVEVLTYSSHRLRRSSLSLPDSLPDSRAFASAALLYQYDCFSALKYVNTSRQVDHAMLFLLHLTQITSNALSLLLSYHRFSNNTSLWRPPQTERDGFWDDPSPSSPSSSSSFPRTRFPSDPTANATVCQDGSAGCYATVQAAVDAAPSFAATRYVIRIKAGVYRETVRVPFEKTNVVFLGDGMGKAVITGALHAGVPGVSTYNTATVAAAGDGFAAKGITIENTAGPGAHQAVAFRSSADLSVLEDMEFLGHQDTLYCHSLRQYYRRCRIEGTVDFVFGNSAAVFEDCTMLVRPRQARPEKGETNAVTAQGRTDPAQATGFVLDGCKVDGTEEYLELYRKKPAVHRNYLGRPWKEYSRTVLVKCYLGEIVRPEGWLPWRGDFALSTLFYGEFGSRGPGGDVHRRVSWSRQIPAEHVRVFSVENFIQGHGWVGAHWWVP